MSNKKRLVATLVAVGVLVGGIGVGGTIAYLTDKTDVTNNTFTVGDLDIETKDVYTEPTEPLTPNEQHDKQVSITNQADSSDAVVYLEVTVPMENVTKVANDGTKGTKEVQDLVYLQQADDLITKQENNFSTQWELLADKADADTKIHTYVFGYKTVLAANETATDLFAKYQLKNIVEKEVTAGTDINIGVRSFAIQADNIVGDSGLVDTSGTLSKETLTDIYTRLVKQAGIPALS